MNIMNPKEVVKIGVIADDFTGASDAASFLAKSGANTVMFTSVPNEVVENVDAVVIALKSRSVLPEEALSMVKEAVDFLKGISCEKIYFKYCSTFDSTAKGNIGVVLDFLLDYLNEPYTIICPSLPVNGRIVKDGELFVHGVKLSESSMSYHPLNPMWDSYIPNLMKDQSIYPCHIVSREELEDNTFQQKLNEKLNKLQKFYVIPDYTTDEDGKNIAREFQHLKLLSGGSGLLEYILDQNEYIKKCNTKKVHNNKSIILCGSCSKATMKQLDKYIYSGGKTYRVDSKDLLANTLDAEVIFETVKTAKEPVLIYSSAVYGNMNSQMKDDTFSLESKLMELLMAKLSEMAIDDGFHNIVVAGGETSGAVTLALGFHGFYIGESIDPGVPALYPISNPSVRLILKSGNFGSEDFFMKATKVYDNE